MDTAAPFSSSSRQPCKYFQQGACKFGSECTFSHENPTAPATRPGRLGYKPKYPNMTLDNSFRAPAQQEKVSDNHSAQNNHHTEGSPKKDRRPGRAGVYKTKHRRDNKIHHSPTRQPHSRATLGVSKSKGKAKANSRQSTRENDQRKAVIENRAATQRTTSKPPNASATVITPEQVIQHDLTTVHTQWPFSCYGISTDWSIAGNIIEGVDFSPEELRLQALCEWSASGAITQYKDDVQRLQMFVEQKRQAVLFNTTTALSDAINRRQGATADNAANGISATPPPPPHPHPPLCAMNPTLNHIVQPRSTSNAMQDDQIGSFQLGHVPLQPPPS